MSRFRDALVVAGFDLQDSLRSRKVLVLLTLYMAGAAAATGLFVTLLREIENTMADALSVASTDKPGTMTQSLMESEQFLDVLGGLVGDPELAVALIALPPIALFYGWLALTFVPILACLTSGDAVASELGSGSARFALTRTDRLRWALGKLLGQAALMGVGIFAGAIGVWVIGYAFLASFAPVDTAWWLVRLGGRAWVHGFAWLGAVMAVSQLTRSTYKALGGSLLVLIGVGIVGAVLDSWWVMERWPVVAETILLLFPRAHRMDLWRPDLLDRLPAMVMLLALGVTWFSIGHLRFARRDA